MEWHGHHEHPYQSSSPPSRARASFEEGSVLSGPSVAKKKPQHSAAAVSALAALEVAVTFNAGLIILAILAKAVRMEFGKVVCVKRLIKTN